MNAKRSGDPTAMRAAKAQSQFAATEAAAAVAGVTREVSMVDDVAAPATASGSGRSLKRRKIVRKGQSSVYGDCGARKRA